MGSRGGYGLLIAVWDDGTIVRADSVDSVGTAYKRGKLNETQLATVRKMIGASGILSTSPSQEVPLDASSETLGLRWGNSVGIWEHTPKTEEFERMGYSKIVELRKNLLAFPLENAVAESPARWKVYPDGWTK